MLRRFVCPYYFAALGSNPKHTNYAFSFIVKFLLDLSLRGVKNENKQKEVRFGPYFRTNFRVA